MLGVVQIVSPQLERSAGEAFEDRRQQLQERVNRVWGCAKKDGIYKSNENENSSMTITSREIRQGQMSWKDGQLAGRKMFESPLIANGQEDHPFLLVIVPLVTTP